MTWAGAPASPRRAVTSTGAGGVVTGPVSSTRRRAWLPVSTTHILSSGVAGTMAANGSGLQWGTVRNLALAWVLTLPAAITLAGVLYVVLRQVF